MTPSPFLGKHRFFYSLSHVLKNGVRIPVKSSVYYDDRSLCIDGGAHIAVNGLYSFPESVEKPYKRTEMHAGKDVYELVLSPE